MIACQIFRKNIKSRNHWDVINHQIIIYKSKAGLGLGFELRMLLGNYVSPIIIATLVNNRSDVP